MRVPMTREEHEYLKGLTIPESVLPPYIDTPAPASRGVSKGHGVHAAVTRGPSSRLSVGAAPARHVPGKRVEFPVFMFVVLTIIALLIMILSRLGGAR